MIYFSFYFWIIFQTQEEWRVVFFIAASIYLFGLLFYASFASGDKQPWADGNQYFDQVDNKEDAELLSSVADDEDDWSM